MCYCPTPTLHLNLALTGDGAFLFSLKNSLCMIYKRFKLWGHWNVLINHLLLVNLCHTHVIIQICVLINHINMPTHTHTHTHTHTPTHTHTHTPHNHTHPHSHTPQHPHTHTHTHVGFYGLRGLSIGVMVFILYKLYVLLPYTYPTHNLALTGDGAFLLSPQKTHTVWFISILNYGDTENVLINHLLLVIPMSYPCHYTNLCPHKPHKHAQTHTHTQNTHTHTVVLYSAGLTP